MPWSPSLLYTQRSSESSEKLLKCHVTVSYHTLPSPSLEMAGGISRPTLNTAFDLVHERTEPVRRRDITWAAPGTLASSKTQCNRDDLTDTGV